MKYVFFAFCDQLEDCEDVLSVVESFFSKRKWNLLIPARSLQVSVDHPMNVNIDMVKKSQLVIVELGSPRMEMAIVHEHAVNHDIPVLHIHKVGTKVLEPLKQYEHLACKYELASDLVEWLEEKVED